MTGRTPPRPRTPRRQPPRAVEQLTTGEYATLVLVLTGALIGTAILVSWLTEQRGLLAPGSTFTPPDLEMLDDEHQFARDNEEPGDGFDAD